MHDPSQSASGPAAAAPVGADPKAWLAEAVARHEQGKIEQAIELYRRILALEPASPDALHFFGLACYQQGDPATARASLERSIALNPRSAAYRANYAAVLLHQGDAAGAIVQGREAVRLDPALGAARTNLGLALLGAGAVDEAVEQLRLARGAEPESAEIRNALGSALKAQGRLPEAIAEYRVALWLAPGYAEAHNNLGLALEEQKSGEGLRHFRAALALRPAFKEAQVNLAAALGERSLVAEADEAYARAEALDPSDGGARLRRALLLPVIAPSREGLAEARRRYAEALARLLDDPPRLADPLSEVGQTGFYLAYHGEDDRPLQENLARLYERACPSLLYTAPHCEGSARPKPGRPLRLGFVSRFFGDHAVGWCFGDMPKGLRRDAFRIVLFSIGGGGSAWREIAAHADEAAVLPGYDLASAREQIAAKELDILVYPDIGIEPMTYFLAFARLAPVQCVAGGHPVTTGLRNLDYFISHAGSEPPEAAAHYSETLVRLAGSSTLYRRPEVRQPLQGRAAFGLPEGAHIYLCPQSLFKFHPDFDEALAAILRGDPAGRLAIFEGPYPEWHALLLARFGMSMPDLCDRVQVLPRLPKEDFLNVVALADVMLDTFHFGGGNTSYQALALGTPVVTLPGAYNRGRITAYLYAQMGVGEAVAASPRDYVRIALALGRDPERRGALSARIRETSHALFDNAPGLAELEAFLLSLSGCD